MRRATAPDCRPCTKSCIFYNSHTRMYRSKTCVYIYIHITKSYIYIHICGPIDLWEFLHAMLFTAGFALSMPFWNACQNGSEIYFLLNNPLKTQDDDPSIALMLSGSNLRGVGGGF